MSKPKTGIFQIRTYVMRCAGCGGYLDAITGDSFFSLRYASHDTDKKEIVNCARNFGWMKNGDNWYCRDCQRNAHGGVYCTPQSRVV